MKLKDKTMRGMFLWPEEPPLNKKKEKKLLEKSFKMFDCWKRRRRWREEKGIEIYLSICLYLNIYIYMVYRASREWNNPNSA
jgi:hypothetical protein